jgi:vanillate O-demethylase ferredoxin subunit
MPDRVLTLRVERLAPLTPEVALVEFGHPWGGRLPGYTPGSHLDVHLPGGFMRQYSLARAMPPSADGRCERYVIGVKREAASRGGSASLHERVRAGDLLAVSAPRNTFALVEGASHHLLLAGGIGLTPLLCMAESLAAAGRADFTLCVFARSRALLPFAEALESLAHRAPGCVRLHLDDPSEPDKLDLHALLAGRAPGAQLYLCGPGGFMAAARRQAAAWPDEAVHVEYFAPPAGSPGGDLPMEPFVLQLARSGVRVPVAAGQTAVAALHDLGLDIPVSCEQGLCGTCVVGWSAGEPEHRDYCLSGAERRQRVALCCSRARAAAGPLVVDL